MHRNITFRSMDHSDIIEEYVHKKLGNYSAVGIF